MKIYNSKTGTKEELVPLKPGEVNIYSCGPTVYNYFHIGNARPFIVFDTLRRYLIYRGYKVTFVQNFTDVDDKMIAAANEQGITLDALAQKYIDAYFEDAGALGINPADYKPRATQHIEDIIKLIEKLIENGHAYEIDGDVYFDVKSDAEYGKLSGQDLEELELGARIDVDENKKNPMDFALWKAQKPGEPAWDSPFGKGRPGWHIECSAMSMKYLGETIDIHGGGKDLLFPHHENEVAQSECATGKQFVRYFMHNGYINIDNKKMSKSEGNFFTVRDILKDFPGEVIRLFMLDSQYRSPINFSRELLLQSETAYARIRHCRENLIFITGNEKNIPVDITDDIKALHTGFIEAMDDDLNTADAIGVIFEFVKQANTLFAGGGTKEAAKKALAALDEVLDVLGLLPKEEAVPAEIIKLAEERKTARAQKDFALADKLRDEITAKGYEVMDTPDGAKITKI